MNSEQFNNQRYNRKKQLYRFLLGIQQLINHPLLNSMWILFAIGVMLLYFLEKKYILNIEVYPMFEKIFFLSMVTMFIILPVISAIVLIQLIGFCFAIKDEADMEIIFGDKRDIKNQQPILMYKKKDKKSGVISREFYTTIPMERWQEKREAICDRMNIHIIGDITYGGKKKNKGHRIYFEAAIGRKPTERGVLYDDIL